MDVLAVITGAAVLREWEAVPSTVTALYKAAAPTAFAIQRIAKRLPCTGVQVWYHPKQQAAHVSLPEGSDSATENRWANVLRPVRGIQNLEIRQDQIPGEGFIRVKIAAPLGFVGKAWNAANNALGGPSPLSSAIVGGLLTGGLGYAGGMALENLFPEEYVERGKLRKNLGMLGLGMGAMPGVWKGTAAWRNSAAAGKPLGWASFLTPDKDVPINPDMLPDLQAQFGSAGAAPKFADYGMSFFNGPGGALHLDTIPVDAFNRAVWNDVRPGIAASENPYGTKSPWGNNSQGLHTPQDLAAATTGIMAGVAAMHGDQPMLSPADVIRGIASAGIGLATATLAGKTLSALAGLTPEAQQGLQRAGIWAGLLKTVIPPLFGR